MTLYNKRLQKYYDDIIKKAIERGYKQEELLMPYLDDLSHQTRSKRIIRMIALAYYLGMLRGVAYVDAMQTPVAPATGTPMYRITERCDDGVAYVSSETGKEGIGYFTTQRRLPELISRLAAYEDTGLTPEQIMELLK